MMPPIPDDPKELTPAWFSRALAAHIPGVAVSTVRVLDQHAGTTGRVRVALDYARDARGPGSLFVKLPPFDADQRAIVEMTGMGRREARFYAELAEALPVRLPRPYHAAHDAGGSRYVMVLEDLEASGCRFPGPDCGGPTARARRVVAGHARIHAALWESPRFAEDLAWVEPPMRHELGAALVTRSLEMFSDGMPPAFRQVGRLYVDRMDAVCDLWDEGERTLVHGDSHLGNLFEDVGGEEPEIGFLDWAVVCRGPGIRDVAYYLASSMPTEARRAQERDLLARYREGLVAAGVDAPDPDTLWHRYRLHVAYAWVAAATTSAMGDRWQPVKVGRAAMARATAAVADLGTVELLRESLGR